MASADGMRFVTSVKTINSGPNRKYFGSGRGITWYNFVSDQYSGFHGIVVPGTLRDSIFVLEGLLEQQTGLAQAIMEVGRVNKTLYLLNYLDDEDYRRRILTQLN